MKFLLPNNDPGFPKQMFEIRQSLKMTRPEFAKLCKIPRASIRRYEDVSVPDKCLPRKMAWDTIKKSLDEANYFTQDIGITIDNNLSGIYLQQSSIKTIWQPVQPYSKK